MIQKNEHMFDKTNLTPLGISILTFLSRWPEREFYTREIAVKLRSSAGGTHKVLGDLYRKNLLKRRKSGKNVYYSVNDRSPAIPFFKIFINITDLDRLVEGLKERVHPIYRR